MTDDGMTVTFHYLIFRNDFITTKDIFFNKNFISKMRHVYVNLNLRTYRTFSDSPLIRFIKLKNFTLNLHKIYDTSLIMDTPIVKTIEQNRLRL